MSKTHAFFYSDERLDQHLVNCSKVNACVVKLPFGEQRVLQFKNFENQLNMPFVDYADFECLLKDHRSKKWDDAAYQAHKAYSVLQT